jgi:DHA3 family tetracycline resistance protein-like MFS transporter
MQHSFEGLDRPGGFARVGLLRPLRSPDFRRLWTGMTVSLIGDGIFLIAMTWVAYQLWNAPAALSVLGIAMTVPTIVCLLAGGVVSDRFDRRLVMLCSDLVRSVALASLAVLSLAHALTYVELAGIVAVYGAGTAFFTPAFEAIVPEIVAAEELAQANALDQFVRPLALRLVGPTLGGWLVASFGGGTAFAVDAVTFAASGAAVLSMSRSAMPRPAGVSPLQTIADGLRFVRRNAWLWGTLASAAIAYLAFLGPTETLLPYVLKNDLHGSAGDLGLVFAAGGAGAIGAAALMAQRRHPRRDVTFMYACWALATLAVAGYGLARSTVQLMIACFVFNALEAAGTIVWATIKQRHVPLSLLGRVSSLDWLISIGLLPVSFAVTAPVAGLIGARTTLVAAALVGTGATVAALLIPGMRDVEGRPPANAGTTNQSAAAASQA